MLSLPWKKRQRFKREKHMDKQKIISFFFDFLGIDLDKLLEGLGVVGYLKRKKIKKAVNDFDKYILERHGDNPCYEGIAKFWKENQVSEELIKIQYNSNSKYKDYEEFKTYLNKLYDDKEDIDKDLSISLMDELYQQLIKTIQETSQFSQADIATLRTINSLTHAQIDGFENNIDELTNQNDNVKINNCERIIQSAKSLDIEIDVKKGVPEITNRNEIQQLIVKYITDDLEDIPIHVQYKELVQLESKLTESERSKLADREIISLNRKVKELKMECETVERCIKLYLDSRLEYSCFKINSIDEFERFVRNVTLLSKHQITVKEGKRYICLPVDVNGEDGSQFWFSIEKSTEEFLKENFNEQMLHLQQGFSAQGVELYVREICKYEKINILSNFIFFIDEKILKEGQDKIKGQDDKYFRLCNYVISPS